MVQIGNRQLENKAVTLYVIAALLFQIYLLSATVLNPSQVKTRVTQSTTEKVLLCTPQGFKWVEISQLIDSNISDSLSGSGEHESLNFHCPLLEACHFFLILVAACLIAMTYWLSRQAICYACYCHFACKQKVYLSVAPKQSPPSIVFA